MGAWHLIQTPPVHFYILTAVPGLKIGGMPHAFYYFTLKYLVLHAILVNLPTFKEPKKIFIPTHVKFIILLLPKLPPLRTALYICNGVR